MKKIQYLFATIVLGLGLTSCGDSFLTQYPEGGTLLEEQYQNLPDRLRGARKNPTTVGLRTTSAAITTHTPAATHGRSSTTSSTSPTFATSQLRVT